MTEVTELVERMRASRKMIFDRVKDVTEDQMLAPARWGQREVTARFMFYRLVAHEAEHTVHLIKTYQSLGITLSETALILKQLQALRGELEGLILGLTDEEVDKTPDNGEWSVRHVIEHILDTEDNYSGQIVDAVKSLSTSS